MSAVIPRILFPHRPLDWGQLQRKWLKCMCSTYTFKSNSQYGYMYLYIMSIKIYTHIRPSCCRTNQFCRKNINTHITYITYKYRVCFDTHFEDVTCQCITVKTFVPKKTLKVWRKNTLMHSLGVRGLLWNLVTSHYFYTIHLKGV